MEILVNNKPVYIKDGNSEEYTCLVNNLLGNVDNSFNVGVKDPYYEKLQKEAIKSIAKRRRLRSRKIY